MNKDIKILFIILFILTGIEGCKHSDRSIELITVDGTANYPEKDLTLQDFLDVEYLPLETNDEFVTQGDIMAIGNKIILVKNWINDGDIYVFDRNTGSAIRKINRKGRGNEEYNSINGVVLDEEKNEVFINCSSTKKIYVYDLFGNFKRSFKHKKDSQYKNICNYDETNLICYDMSGYFKEGENLDNQTFHAIISKQDGSVTRDISIPINAFKTPVVQEAGGVAVTSVRSIIRYHDSWLLVETSSDTIYNYIPNGDKLIPFLVKTSTENPDIFLTIGTLTDRYYFMETVKKVYDFKTGRGFPTAGLMYDRQENALFSPSVLNSDFVKRKAVDMTSHPVNKDIATFQTIDAYQLVEAYNNGELKGKLKDIAAKLNEQSNPVIMIMKYKK